MEGTNLVTLPIEIQFEIADYLRPSEHFSLALVCRQSRSIHQAAILKHREMINLHGTHICYNELRSLANIIQNSVIREKYTTSLTMMRNEPFEDSESEPTSDDEDVLIQTEDAQVTGGDGVVLIQTEEIESTWEDDEFVLKQICRRGYRSENFPVGFEFAVDEPEFPLMAQLITSLPYLEVLDLASYHHFSMPSLHNLMRAALKDGGQFRYLKDVYLNHSYPVVSSEYDITRTISLLPSVRSIWVDKLDSHEGRDTISLNGVSYIKDLALHNACMYPPHLAEILSMCAGLERFTYLESLTHPLGGKYCNTDSILRALVDSTSDSLLSIHLWDTRHMVKVCSEIESHTFKMLM